MSKRLPVKSKRAIPSPKHGWDHPADVAAGKRYCKDIAYAILPGAEIELLTVKDAAVKLHGFGVSLETAVKLLSRYAETDMSENVILGQCIGVYENPDGQPGRYSTMRLAPEDRWMDGEPEDEKSIFDAELAWPRPVAYDNKQHAAKCAEAFVEARPAKLIYSDGSIYTLDDSRIWRKLTDTELAAEIRATDPSLIFDTDKIQRMVRAVHVAHFTKARPFDWINEPIDAPPRSDLILARNGILNLATDELMPHTGKLFITGLPEWDYDANADCPLWLNKVGEWLHPSFHPTLQEFMGYCLTSDTSLEILLAMIGASRGGKGSITRIIQALVGPALHTSRTLNDLSGDFGLEGMLDKRLIVIPDAHDTDTSRRSAAIERIKCISGRDELSINRKNLPIITAKVPAKLILVANKHPKFLDESGALANRELLLVFGNSFVGREDRDLANKLNAELPGIANWALDGLRRLRANDGKFTIGERGRAASRELAESQSPARRFAKDCLIVTGAPNDYVSLDEAYYAYQHWGDHIENLGSRERRNRNDFKHDLIAALTPRGVSHGQRRWHDPSKSKSGKGLTKRGFFGFKVKPKFRVTDECDIVTGNRDT